ncbi:MAG: hypothetical protein ACREX5_13815 [Achromobacter pestifer]
MDLTCLQELPELDWIMYALAVVVGLASLALGVYLLLNPRPVPGTVAAKFREFGFRGPVPVVLIALFFVLIGGSYLQLNSRFPADAEQFAGAPRTLASIADGLRRNSGADIQFKGDAGAVVISQPVSGACSTALLDNLCAMQRDTLMCSREGKRFVIARR